jgi:hypothetical protein
MCYYIKKAIPITGRGGRQGCEGSHIVYTTRSQMAVGLSASRTGHYCCVCVTQQLKTFLLLVPSINNGFARRTLRYHKQTPWPLVRKRTIPTDRPPLVDKKNEVPTVVKFSVKRLSKNSQGLLWKNQSSWYSFVVIWSSGVDLCMPVFHWKTELIPEISDGTLRLRT